MCYYSERQLRLFKGDCYLRRSCLRIFKTRFKGGVKSTAVQLRIAVATPKVNRDCFEENITPRKPFVATYNMKGVIDVLKMQKEQEAQKMKSRRVEYKGQDTFFMAARFIFECGYKLKCHPITVTTAATLFHKFFRESESGAYDKYLIAATSLYLAGKSRSEQHKLRDVINVTHHTLHRGSHPLDLKEEYWNRRDAIVQAELLLMRVLKFHIEVTTPHKYLLHYLKTLQGWLPQDVWKTVPLSQSAFAFLQDFHHDASILDYSHQQICIACVNLALLCYGVQVPYVEKADDQTWYTALYKNIKKDEIWEVMERLIDIYNKDPLSGD